MHVLFVHPLYLQIRRKSKESKEIDRYGENRWRLSKSKHEKTGQNQIELALVGQRDPRLYLENELFQNEPFIYFF